MKQLFDVNLSTGRWPFRRLPLEKLSDLSVRLRAAGISGGLVRSLEAPFSMNVYEANDLLLESCRNHPELRGGMVRIYAAGNTYRRILRRRV